MISADPGKWGQFALPEAFSEPQQIMFGLFHSLSVGFAVFDESFRYLAINNALAAINGIPAQEHLGRTLRDVLGSFAPSIELQFARVLSTAEPLWNLELTGTLPTRTEAGWWTLNFFPVQDSSGRVKQIGVLVVEVTKERQLEERVRAHDRRFLLLESDYKRFAEDLSESLRKHHAMLRSELNRLSRPARANEVLRSWKVIAEHFGTSIRTVQRWEEEQHLPIRRLKSSRGAAVFAFTADLEDWLKANSQYSEQRRI